MAGRTIGKTTYQGGKKLAGVTYRKIKERKSRQEEAKAAEEAMEQGAESGKKLIKLKPEQAALAKENGKRQVKAAPRVVKVSGLSQEKIKTQASMQKQQVEKSIQAMQKARVVQMARKSAQASAESGKAVFQVTGKGSKLSVQGITAAIQKGVVALEKMGKWIAAGGGAFLLVFILIVGIIAGAAFSSSSESSESLSDEVLAYTSVIQQYASQYGIPEYVSAIQAIMMQESGGRGTDPMQCSESPYNTRFSHSPGSITDPDYSIEVGVQTFADCISQAGCSSPQDMDKLKLAWQGYNYGNGYIGWALQRGGYTEANEKYILAWKNQLPEEEYDEELKEEREKFSRFRLTYTHQLADIERLIAEKEFSKAQLLEDYIVTEYIRTTHSIRAREIIATYWAGKIVYQDTDLTEDLATICYSHNESYTYLLQMESFRVCGQDEYLCIPFVATILRLADIIDFDPKRTPSVLFSHLAVKNPVSLNEWKKHQSINAWTISPKRILFSAQCEHPAIEATILAFCNQIDEELRNGTVILSNLSDDGMGINMETYKIPLPPQVDRRKIQAKKDIISGKPIYRYHDTKFSLSKKQIIDLLMGTKLYGKPEVALRELLQNSIDACLLRQKLSELWGIEYTPKVKVSLYTKNNVDYLQVSDNGVGMNQHIIDNYYTNIGCSYYSSREFSDLMVSFKSSFTPISRFGIGILSCFMVCDSMEVTTRRIRERFECDEALHVSIEGYESLFVISDSDKKDPGTDTILTLRPVHPWDRMDEDEFVQCIKGIVPNPAVQIEIETDKRSESYSSDYFDDLDLSPLLDYSWNNTKNIRKIDIDLTCEEYGFKGRGCIGILIKNDMPVEEIEILSKDVEIDGEIYTLSSSVKYKNNCITETSTSISVDEDGEIDTNTSWSERFKSKSSLSIHGIEVPYNLFPNYSNKMSKAVLNILFPFSFRLDIGVNSDLNLNSARDQIIYDEKWLTFEENLYQVICKRLKEQLSLSDWERLNEIIQKNGKNIFSRVANNIE